MDQPVTPLGKIIERQRAAKVREENLSRLSNREIGRRAAEYNDGEDIHWQTIGRYISSGVDKAKPGKLAALARVLATPDCPPSELLREMQNAAGLPVGDGVSWSPPAEIVELNRSEREVVDSVIRSIANAKRVTRPPEQSD